MDNLKGIHVQSYNVQFGILGAIRAVTQRSEVIVPVMKVGVNEIQPIVDPRRPIPIRRALEMDRRGDFDRFGEEYRRMHSE